MNGFDYPYDDIYPHNTLPAPLSRDNFDFLNACFFYKFNALRDRKKMLEFRNEVLGACRALEHMEQMTRDELNFVIRKIDSIIKLKLEFGYVEKPRYWQDQE